MNALEIYNETAENLGITDELNTRPVARLSFAREQSEQMKMLVNRLLFDLTMTKSRMNLAQDDDSRAAYAQKVSEYERDLRQTREGLKVALELVKELESVVNEG